MKGTFRVGPVRLERIREQVKQIVAGCDELGDERTKRTATSILRWVEQKGRMTDRQADTIDSMVDDVSWWLVK